MGFCITVLLSLWSGYSGTELLLGKIANFNITASPPFLLEVDDEPGNTYTIQYNVVLAYAWVEHPTFKNFRFPNMMPEEPAPDDTVGVRRSALWSRTTSTRSQETQCPSAAVIFTAYADLPGRFSQQRQQ